MPLTLEKANTIISAALEHARQENLKPLSVIILDDRAALVAAQSEDCLLYTSPSPRDSCASRMPSSA